MILDGRDIAAFIKQRHYQQARGIRPQPVLGIIQSTDDPATKSYIRAKQLYGEDIGVRVEVHRSTGEAASIAALINQLNDNSRVKGIVLQLPLPNTADADEMIQLIELAKDIDSLRDDSAFAPPTPTGIFWLLGSYGISVKGKTAVIVGQGRLVGRPLTQMMQASGAEVITCDEHTDDLKAKTLEADILVTAAGQPGLIKPGMVNDGTVVIDAAGDADPALFDNDTLKITPTPGGVGPMTVAALFENLLLACYNQAR